MPLYNVELSINPDEHKQFIFQPQQQFHEQLGEIAAKTRHPSTNPYILVPDNASEAAFNPALSSATFVGQEEKPGAGITQDLTPPPSYTGEAHSDASETVHLHWTADPKAEGYLVFATDNRDTAFSATPVLAASTKGGAETQLPLTGTEAFIEVPDRKTRYYAVTSIVNGRPTLAIRLIPAAAGKSLPELGKMPASAEQQRRIHRQQVHESERHEHRALRMVSGRDAQALHRRRREDDARNDHESQGAVQSGHLDR